MDPEDDARLRALFGSRLWTRTAATQGVPNARWAQALDDHAAAQAYPAIQGSGYVDDSSPTYGPVSATSAAVEPPPATAPTSLVLDPRSAAPDEGAQLILVGKNTTDRRHYVKEKGGWLLDPKTGRNQDLHHMVPLSEGGSRDVSNMQPLPHDEHVRLHSERGDFSKWGKKGAIARWGKAVKPPGELEGLGILGMLPDITGVISGRIRTDSPWNFWADMAGYKSPDDLRREREDWVKNGI